MTQQDIIELAKSLGFKTNHFLRLRDKKSGAEVAGKFTKYKQFHTNGLRIKGENFEVDIITNGEPNFDIIQSVELSIPEDVKTVSKWLKIPKDKIFSGGILASKFSGQWSEFYNANSNSLLANEYTHYIAINDINNLPRC